MYSCKSTWLAFTLCWWLYIPFIQTEGECQLPKTCSEATEQNEAELRFGPCPVPYTLGCGLYNGPGIGDLTFYLFLLLFWAHCQGASLWHLCQASSLGQQGCLPSHPLGGSRLPLVCLLQSLSAACWCLHLCLATWVTDTTAKPY